GRHERHDGRGRELRPPAPDAVRGRRHRRGLPRGTDAPLVATSRYQSNGHDESAAASFQRGREEARAVGSMVAEIANDIRGLATKEVALAQAEAKETVSITVRAVV